MVTRLWRRVATASSTPPTGPISELKGVKVGLYKGKETLQDDLLRAFHGKGRKGNGSVVVQFSWFGCLGDRDNDERGFPEGGYSAGVDRLLKNGQIVCLFN